MIKHAMRKSSAVLLALLLSGAPGAIAPLWAQQAAGTPVAAASSDSSSSVTVDDVVVAPDQVTLKLSDEAQYKTLVTQNPPRLIIDLIGVEYGAGAKRFDGKGKYVKDVRGAQYAPQPNPVSRIVLDLTEIPGYKIAKNGSDLVVNLGPAASQGSGPAPAAATSQAASAPKAPASAPAPSPVAAKSKPATAAKPVVKPAAQVAQAAPTSKAAEKPGSMATENNPELVAIATKSDAAQEDGSAAAAPATRKRAAAVGASHAAGGGDLMSELPTDPVTLDFDNTDLRDVIKLLSTKAGVNIIYGSDINGSLTLHLSNVPFNEAFRTVLLMSNLATTQIGDHVLRVLTPGSLINAQKSSGLVTRVVSLSYAKAADLVTTVTNVQKAEGRLGTAQADLKTNSVIITESPESLASTERLIQQLDQKPQQVLIEAKLVEVGLNNSLNYGIQWDYTSVENSRLNGQQGTNYNGTTVGPPAGAVALPPPLNGAPAVPAANGGSGIGAGARGTGVNLPATTVFGALTLGRITNNYFVNATLTAAAAQGKVKVLSDPKIATLNNQPANINVTTQIPYVTSNVASTGVQTQTVSYATTGIQLQVTPTINADGRITLLINPNVSQPSATAAASVTGAPAIDSRNATTTVLVHDGETIVIGGLIADSVSNQIAKIPLLGDIPILGWLFKKKTVTRTRAELLIFVTPKILPD